MIDRLEELLLAVEEREEGDGVVAIPPEMWQGKKLVIPSAAEDEAGSDPVGVSFGREESLPDGRSGEQERGVSVSQSRLTPDRTSGLAALYRQVIREPSFSGISRPASVAVVQEVSSPSAPGLTAGELDLAMRRDSRRYDGGMTIY